MAAIQTKPKKTKKTAQQKRASKRRRILKVRVTPQKQQATLPLDIRDAMKVYKAAKRFFKLCKKKRLKTSDLTELQAQIKLAKKTAGGGRVTLSGKRRKLKDLLGAYRTAARLASRTLHGGVNHELAKTLRVDLPYPDTEEQFDAYVDGLGDVIKTHSAILLERDFSEAEQQELTTAADEFHRAYTVKPQTQKEAQDQTQEHERVFAELRTSTSYVREIGMAALKNDTRRTEFDRIPPEHPRKPKAKPKAKPKPAPVTPPVEPPQGT